MPRYTPPSHYDERLVNGTLTFYETGTTTLKTVYSDVNLGTPIANPVSLGSLGEEPNIFFAGSARVIGKDSDGVQVFDRDPIGDDAAVGEFGAWDSNTVYAINDLVTGSNGNRYRSLQNTNQGNDPTLSPGANQYWEHIKFIPTWNNTISYALNDFVVKDGSIYRSLGGSNLNNDPATDDGNWTVAIDTSYAIEWVGKNGNVIPSRTALPNPVSQTIEGSLGNGANVTDITRLTRTSPTYTLDASTFAAGDVVIVRNTYNTDLYGDITVTTDAGSIYLPDSTNAASHTMAGDVNFTVEFHKYDAANWVVTIY